MYYRDLYTEKFINWMQVIIKGLRALTVMYVVLEISAGKRINQAIN